MHRLAKGINLDCNYNKSLDILVIDRRNEILPYIWIGSLTRSRENSSLEHNIQEHVFYKVSATSTLLFPEVKDATNFTKQVFIWSISLSECRLRCRYK